MEGLLAKPDPDAIGPPVIAKDIDSSIGKSPDSSSDTNEPNGSSSTSPSSSSAPSNPLPFDAPVPTHPVQVFDDATLTDEVFRKVWIKGEPLVVTGLLHKFHISWTPDYFRTKYANQNCLILECQSDQNKRVTVGEFFAWFGEYEGRRDCWKLKVRICNVHLFKCVLMGRYGDRTGLHQRTSRRRSPNYMMTLIGPSQYLTTSGVTACSTLLRISLAIQLHLI